MPGGPISPPLRPAHRRVPPRVPRRVLEAQTCALRESRPGRCARAASAAPRSATIRSRSASAESRYGWLSGIGARNEYGYHVFPAASGATNATSSSASSPASDQDVGRRRAASVHRDDDEPRRRRVGSLPQNRLWAVRIAVHGKILVANRHARSPTLACNTDQQLSRHATPRCTCGRRSSARSALALTPRTNHCWNVALLRDAARPRDAADAVRRAAPSPSPSISSTTSSVSSARTAGRAVAAAPAADGRRLLPAADGHAARRSASTSRIWTMPVEMPDPIRFDQDPPHAPTIRTRRIASGVCCSRSSRCSSSSAAGSSASAARCISSGAASISR